jgi:hypothetical protein
VSLFGDYYLGGGHSRVMMPNPNNTADKHKSFHFTHLVILDVRHWNVVHVSKPLLYDTKHFADDNRFCIQDPISLIRIENFTYSVTQDRFIDIDNTASLNSSPDADKQHRFLLTSNIADRYSLAYELDLNVTAKEVSELALRRVPSGTNTMRRVAVDGGYAVAH